MPLAVLEVKMPLDLNMPEQRLTQLTAVFSAGSSDSMEDWTTFWVKIWKGEPVTLQGAEALSFMKKNTHGLIGVFKDAVGWTPEGSPCWINEMRYWIAEPWDNLGGRVTLLGDAAHPMLICESDFSLNITCPAHFLHLLFPCFFFCAFKEVFPSSLENSSYSNLCAVS
jgi:hypothetical protein